MALPYQVSMLSPIATLSASTPAQRVIAAAISSLGTDQRSALPRQLHLVSEGKLTCQRGSWEVAATAACDPDCVKTCTDQKPLEAP